MSEILSDILLMLIKSISEDHQSKCFAQAVTEFKGLFCFPQLTYTSVCFDAALSILAYFSLRTLQLVNLVAQVMLGGWQEMLLFAGFCILAEEGFLAWAAYWTQAMLVKHTRG